MTVVENPAPATTSPSTKVSAPLRPGVPFPDWEVVTSPAARDALAAILSPSSLAQRWSGYDDEEDRVHRAVLEALIELDRFAGTAWLAARAGVSEIRVAEQLNRLAWRDLVVRDNRTGALTGAYPLTVKPTEHSVRIGVRSLHALCAIDALGVGAMLGTDTLIESRCRTCGRSVCITTRERGSALYDVEPVTTIVWSGNWYDGTCAATTLCRVIAFFCSGAHLEEWRGAACSEAPGFALTPSEALEVGRALFAPFLKPAAGDEGLRR